MISSISVSELKQSMDKGMIIDIRTIEKYNQNHIPGAHNIPSEKLLSSPSKYLKTNIQYYIYCQRGMNSIKICNLLQQLGYHVANIIGGYEKWILES